MRNLPFDTALPCAGTYDGIYNPSPCNDFPFQTIRRIILAKKENAQNGTSPTFATVADLSVALNWTTFLTQAPITSDTVMVTTSLFEGTRAGGRQNKVANGYNNYSVQGTKTNTIYTFTFQGVSQEFINAMLAGTDDNFSSTAVWFVTDNNELVYLDDTSVIPRMLPCVVALTADEGSTEGETLQKYVLELEIGYGLSSNLKTLLIPTSAANLIGLT